MILKHLGFIFSLVCLGTGCAGYNHTMFMTKSNAGLDFDSKPPTAEVTISRKESVIAPTFQGGQTPAVMASFKPHAGAGSGFANFFLGVDQTFAGGDAAIAMSQLYDKPTVTDKSQFDSAIRLTEAPDYRNFLQRVPGEGKVRPLIFGTDTSLGLKVAWSGIGGQIPDTVKLGFNRKEFAWAPLSTTPIAGGKEVDVKMPAFMATIESKQNVGTNGKIEIQSLQYFATGDSATYLAMQRDVRAAMLARLDPNKEIYKANFGGDTQNVLSDTLFTIGTILARFDAKKDVVASGLLKKLNNLQGISMPDSIGTDQNPEYSFNATSKLIEKNQSSATDLRTKSLADITAYLSSMERSKSALANAMTEMSNGQKLQLKNGSSSAIPVTPAIQGDLAREFAVLASRLDNLKAALSSNRDVIASYRYVESMISPQ